MSGCTVSDSMLTLFNLPDKVPNHTAADFSMKMISVSDTEREREFKHLVYMCVDMQTLFYDGLFGK